MFSALLPAVLSLVRPAPADMTLVERGEPRATIVIGAEPSRTDRWCAQELQTWLGKITGAELPIVTDAEPVTGNVLAVGRNRYTEALYERTYAFEEHVVRTVSPECLAFVGWESAPAVNAKGEWLRDNERGPLYAVYAFLEDLGVRWFYPGDWGWYAPQQATLTVGEYDLDRTPATVIRWGINAGGSEDKAWNAEVATWAVRSRLNTWLWSATDKGGYLHVAYGGHNFHQIFPADAYYEAHPDWFPLVNGRRVREGQLCLANPEVVQRFAAAALASFAGDSDCGYFPIWPNDSGVGWCECDGCRAMDGPNGNIADRLMKFTNAVAEITGKQYPDRILFTAAYTPAYFDPPTTVKPARNVWVQVCRYWPVGDSSSTYRNQLTDQARHYYRALQEWSALCPTFLYTYYGFYGSDLYYPIVYQLFADWPVKAEWGLKGGYAQTSQHWATNAWVYYTYPRVMFDPTLDEAAFRHDYFSRCYGRGGEAMRAFFEAVEARFRETPCVLEWETVEGLLTAALIAEMEQHLRAAEQAAAEDDERTRVRVAVVREGFEYAKQHLRFRTLLDRARAGDRSAREPALAAYQEVSTVRRRLAARGLLGLNEHSFAAEIERLGRDLTGLPAGAFSYADYYKQGGYTALDAREVTFPLEYWGFRLPGGGSGSITYEVGSKVAAWEQLEATFVMDGKRRPNGRVEVSTDAGATWQDAPQTLDLDAPVGTWDLTELVQGRSSVLVRYSDRNDADETVYVLTNVSLAGSLTPR
ncbi:MAG: DUF4838 domain-containing protein [Armatimonadetes bacterium]|nr:DUF4838 domain-containing protein [Armatimonadota bacterium]